MFSNTFDNCFVDKRLDDRGNEFIRSLFSRGSQSIRQISQSSARQKAYYRFLQNEFTTQEDIIKGITGKCGNSVAGRVVLCIQDTSELNFYNHKNRIKHDHTIGVTNAAKNGLGFMIHPSVVIDAVNCFPYGYGHIHMFNRDLEREPEESRDKHAYKKLDIEQKESNKWLLSSQAAKETLKEAAMVIIVQDREGDIYEQFATIPEEKTHLLIRAKSDRSLPEGTKLFSKVSGSEVAGIYNLQIDGDKRKNQQKRTAKMEVRFSEVELKNPSRTAKDIAPTVKLNCVEAKEVGVISKSAVCWRLLTTLPVSTFEEAMMIIEWYEQRWMIEEVFRILKKEGFDIEASELESGESIRKLTLLILDAIIKIFQMKIAYETDEEGEIPSTVCFDENEVELMELQCKNLQGNTEKQKNTYPKSSLRYATWVIARLGGWKGYASERRPGITTLWTGLQRFYDSLLGYNILKDVSTR